MFQEDAILLLGRGGERHSYKTCARMHTTVNRDPRTARGEREMYVEEESACRSVCRARHASFSRLGKLGGLCVCNIRDRDEPSRGWAQYDKERREGARGVPQHGLSPFGHITLCGGVSWRAPSTTTVPKGFSEHAGRGTWF